MDDLSKKLCNDRLLRPMKWVMRARPVLPHRTYMVTRRCSERRCFLRPSKETNEIVKYELAKCAHRYDMKIHAYVIMSNHLHIVLTDTHGELPDFMRDFLREVSKAVSAEIGRWDGIWEPGTYSRVELLDPHRATAACVYSVTNGVAAGLVARADEWPGVSSIHDDIDKPIQAHRPSTRYYRNSRQQEVIEMRVTPPPGLSDAEFRVALEEHTRIVEERAAKMRAATGKKVLGVQAVLRRNPYDSPTSRETRRGRNPSFASTDKWKRIEAGQRKQAWYESYQRALEAFIRGVRDVAFPAGTWKMVRLFGCCSEPVAPPT